MVMLHLFCSQYYQSVSNGSSSPFVDRHSVLHQCIAFTGSARIRMLCIAWVFVASTAYFFLKSLKTVSLDLLFIVPQLIIRCRIWLCRIYFACDVIRLHITALLPNPIFYHVMARSRIYCLFSLGFNFDL